MNIQTRKKFGKLVHHPKKIIRFRANPALIENGPFPPPPLSVEMNQKGDELEQLLSRLGFPDPDLLDLRPLLGAVDGNLDRLLACLRTLIQEERLFSDFSVLCHTVYQMHWVRG